MPETQAYPFADRLEPVVREGAVGLGHAVGVFAALDSGAGVVGGIHKLGYEAVPHTPASALAGCGKEPAYSQGLAAVALDLDGNLIGCATYATGLDLDDGGGVADSLLEHFEAGALGAFLKLVNRIIQDALGEALLAAHHELVDEARDHCAVEARIG